MQPLTDKLTAPRGTGAPAATLPDPQGFEAMSPRPDPVVSSAQLLQGRKAVQIEHNGALYMLRTTKLGKLILTK